MSLVAVYDVLVNLAVKLGHLPPIDWGAESTVLNGVALSFLIAFRNKHAYDQWWEARKLWGQLINESRNLCLKVRALAGIEPAGRERIGVLVIAFGQALKDHLRHRAVSKEAAAELRSKTDAVHQPVKLAGDIYETVARWQRHGRLDGWTLLWLDGQVKSLMDICGACERIQSTPLSSSYRALLRHAIGLYVLVAPFYLFEDADTGVAGLPLFILAAYFLLGTEMVAEDIEDPFGTGGDDLPLESYCATIETSVREILDPAAGMSRG